MPRWDDPRGPRYDPEHGRWPRDDRGRGGGERRSFGEDRWASDRYAAPYDRDRLDYGGRDEDAGAAGYAHRRGEREAGPAYGEQGGVPASGPPYAYGQDYGLESEGGFGGPASSGPGWGLERNGERRRNFDFDDPGVGQSQAGYGERAQSHPDHDFDPDYLRWRDAQLREHDRDYQHWRREQHRLYDDEYRRFRSERQRHFGQAFHEWRSQRSAVGGAPDTSVVPGVSGYGDRSSYYGSSAYDTPSGMLDSPGHLSTDPAMSQRGGSGGGQGATQAQAQAGGDRAPEFGKEPSQVQAASDGEVQGHDEARKDEDRGKGDPRRH